MTVLGVGIDLVKTARIQLILTNPNISNGFIQRVLHPREIADYAHNSLLDNRVRFLAGSWAAKEALFKSLDPEDQRGFTFKDWYRFRDEFDRPFIWNDGYRKNDQFFLSISHDDDYLVANVVRQAKGS